MLTNTKIMWNKHAGSNTKIGIAKTRQILTYLKVTFINGYKI